MGLSVSASAAVIGAALITGLTALAVEGLNTWERIEEAEAKGARLAESRIRCALQVYDVTHDAGGSALTVKVNNTGSETLNAALVDILVDGLLKTADVSSRTVDGVAATSVWAPGQQLVAVVGSVASAPTKSVKVVAENGCSAVWVMT